MGRKARTLNDLVLMVRKLVDWTQLKMSDKTGIGQPHLCDIENGHRPATEPKIQAIAKATKCSFWIHGRGSCLLDQTETKEVKEWLEGELDVDRAKQNKRRKK